MGNGNLELGTTSVLYWGVRWRSWWIEIEGKNGNSNRYCSWLGVCISMGAVMSYSGCTLWPESAKSICELRSWWRLLNSTPEMARHSAFLGTTTVLYLCIDYWGIHIAILDEGIQQEGKKTITREKLHSLMKQLRPKLSSKFMKTNTHQDLLYSTIPYNVHWRF